MVLPLHRVTRFQIELRWIKAHLFHGNCVSCGRSWLALGKEEGGRQERNHLPRQAVTSGAPIWNRTHCHAQAVQALFRLQGFLQLLRMLQMALQQRCSALQGGL